MCRAAHPALPAARAGVSTVSLLAARPAPHRKPLPIAAPGSHTLFLIRRRR